MNRLKAKVIRQGRLIGRLEKYYVPKYSKGKRIVLYDGRGARKSWISKKDFHSLKRRSDMVFAERKGGKFKVQFKSYELHQKFIRRVKGKNKVVDYKLKAYTKDHKDLLIGMYGKKKLPYQSNKQVTDMKKIFKETRIGILEIREKDTL